jgi:hypothetical protein
VVLKPLHGNGGSGVVKLKADDPNLDALIEIHAAGSRDPLVIQKFIPAVSKGDKRIILIDGEPVGAINRVPAAGAVRSNLHVGGTAMPVELTAARSGNLQGHRPDPEGTRPDLRRHRCDRRLSDRDQRHLPHRRPAAETLHRHRRHRPDVGRHRGETRRHKPRRVANPSGSWFVPLWRSENDDMLASVATVAFEGVEARRVDVQVQQIGAGEGSFAIVGLPDKAVAESRERVRGAFAGIGLALPARRIIANLAPADLPKEGSHFDLPIALALLASMGVITPDALEGWAAMGELGLDGRIAAVGGTLSAAMAANAMGLGLICPEANGPEAAWAGDVALLAPRSLIGLVNHFKGTQVLRAPERGPVRAGNAVARPARGQGSGERQARAGGRRRRGPQPAVHRPARLGQVDDGGADAGPAAAADDPRIAGDLANLVGGRDDRARRPDP